MTTELNSAELNSALKLGDLIEQLESEIDRYEISMSKALARVYAAWLDCNALNEAHLMALISNLQKMRKTIPVGDLLKEAMRPKPPSLKEQAKFAAAVLRSPDETCSIAELQQHWHTICNALEQLND